MELAVGQQWMKKLDTCKDQLLQQRINFIQYKNISRQLTNRKVMNWKS